MSRSGPEPLDFDDFLHRSAYETGVDTSNRSFGTEGDMEEEGIHNDGSPVGTDGLQRHSCVLCQQRKVKCNRTEPCSNCVKQNKACEYRAPPPPKRRARKAPELGLHARVKRYEQLLQKFGVKVEELTAEEDGDGEYMEGILPQETNAHVVGFVQVSERKQPQEERPKGRLVISKSGSTRYLETGLWKDLHDELHDPEVIIHDDPNESSEDEPIGLTDKREVTRVTDSDHFILGGVDSGFNLEACHPHPDVAMKLWRAFLENVDPLTKLFHPPSVEDMLQQYINQPSKMPKNFCSLAFTIYLFAVVSMTAEEVEQTTGVRKSVILRRFRQAAQVALVRTHVLRTADLVVLQAFTLFLLALRQHYDARSLWVLVGVAVRIAQRMGLHKDNLGSELPPFQVEMRRRLWWQVIILDRTTAEISGAGVFATGYEWDTKVPLNLEDSDLYPDMKELPPEREGATGMIFCLMRYQLGSFFRGINKNGELEGGDPNDSWKKFSMNSTIQDRDKAIEGLQRSFEQRFLRYCDPLNKLHYMVSVVARSILCMLTMVTHHPRQYPDKGASMPQAEKDMLFHKALKIIEYGNLLQTSPMTKGFLWHVNVFFTWQAFIFLLEYLVKDPTSIGADKAWDQLQEIYRNHPALLTDRSNSLHIAVRRLTLKAWDAREEQLKESGRLVIHPEIVKDLRTEALRQNSRKTHTTASQPHQPQQQQQQGQAQQQAQRHEWGQPGNPAPGLLHFEGPSPGAQQQMSLMPTPEGSASLHSFPDLETPTDWSQWDNLIGGVEWQTMNLPGFEEIQGFWQGGMYQAMNPGPPL